MHDLARAPLVCRIDVGVEIADRERLHALRLQLSGRGGDRLLVQGRQHRPGGIEPFRDPEAAMAGREGTRLLEQQVVEGRADLALDLQHVPESLGGEEAGRGQLPLDDRVGGDRGAVHEGAHLRRLDARLAQDALDGFEEAHRRIAGGGGDLRDAGPAALLVDQDAVGEGPSDVDAQPVPTGCRSLSMRVTSRAHRAGLPPSFGGSPAAGSGRRCRQCAVPASSTVHVPVSTATR